MQHLLKVLLKRISWISDALKASEAHRVASKCDVTTCLCSRSKSRDDLGREKCFELISFSELELMRSSQLFFSPSLILIGSSFII